MQNNIILQQSKVAVFIDYWNVQLTINSFDKKTGGNGKFNIDWTNLNNWIISKLSIYLNKPPQDFQHVVTHIYTSYNSSSITEQKYRNWTSNFLSLQPGMKVTCLDRHKKGNVTCPSCQHTISNCPNCSNELKPTQEKGIDTRLSLQMLDLASNNSYDIAVILSHDADMVPAVEFVQARGKIVFHFGISPLGAELRKACNHHYDIKNVLNEIKR